MTIRTLTAADVPDVVSLLNEATPELPVDAAEVESWLANTVHAVEFALAEEEAGTLIGYADVAAAPSDPDKAWLDLRVPARAAYLEAAGELLDWAEASARRQGRAVLRTSAASGSPLVPILAARGYEPIRYSFRMRIDLGGPPPDAVWPAGISVRTFRPGDERAVHAAHAEAFQDHWDFTGFPYEEFEEFMLRAPDFDPSLWLIAEDGAEIAGVSLCRPSHPGRPGVGWVRSLAVRRPWRRRGLGLALLLASFRAFWERGTRVVGLGVDGENTTGAVRLYEKAGMRVEHRLDQYERRLA